MNNKTFTSQLNELAVGEFREFPASLCTTARSMASTLSFKWDKKFTTKTDRQRKIIIVKRIE